MGPRLLPPTPDASARRAARRATCFALLAAGASVLASCGSRGPLEDDLAFAPSDAATDTPVSPVPDAAALEDAETDATTPPRDAGRDAAREAGPVETVLQCVGCVADTCGEPLVGCLQSAPCRDVVQCVVTTCLAGGGGPDPVCLFGCAAGSDPASLQQAVGVFQCVAGTCGASCSSAVGVVLGALPGLPGVGGVDGGAPPPPALPDGGRPNGPGAP